MLVAASKAEWVMRILWFFPVLVYAAIIYAAIALTGGDDVGARLAQGVFALDLPSGVAWELTLGQIVLIIAVACFALELLKSTEPSQRAIAEIGIAALASVVFLLLFVLSRPFGTSEFFIITVMSILDFFMGFMFLVSESRRTVEIERE